MKAPGMALMLRLCFQIELCLWLLLQVLGRESHYIRKAIKKGYILWDVGGVVRMTGGFCFFEGMCLSSLLVC